MTLYRTTRDGRIVPDGQHRTPPRARHHDPSRSWRSTADYRRWRDHVLTTGDRCVHCGHTGSRENPLTAGHKIAASIRPDLRLDPSNGQVECRSCNSTRGDRHP